MAIGVPVLLYNGITASAASGSASGVCTAGAAAGNLIVVAVGSWTAGYYVSALTDSAGNSYTLAKVPLVADQPPASIFYCVNCPHALTTSTTFTPTLNGGSSPTWGSLVAVSVTGANGGFDVANNFQGTTGLTLSCPTGALNNANEIVFGAYILAATEATQSESAGFTNIANNVSYGFDFGYDIVSSASSVAWAPSWTATNSSYAGQVATFMITSAAVHGVIQVLLNDKVSMHIGDNVAMKID